MEFIFLHKCIKDTSTNETILTEHWLNICRRSWTPERTGEIPSELGRMKKRREKKKEREWEEDIRWDLHPWGYWRRGKFLTSGEIPSNDGDIKWDRRGASGAVRGEWNSMSVAHGIEWDLYRWSMPQPCTPQPGIYVCHCAWSAVCWNVGIGKQTLARTVSGCRG